MSELTVEITAPANGILREGGTGFTLQNIDGWEITGDAYWDAGGWLELTGLSQGKGGWIFKTSSTVNPGDVSISFSIRTGGGINTGADGFALSVFNVESVEELRAVIDSAAVGGCLGYGVTAGCGDPGNLLVEAFHIEIDTWHNSKPGNPMDDPTDQNHIAIALDGNPDNHVLWYPVPSIEDTKWHDLVVEIEGSHVTVTLDQSIIIDDDAPGLSFRGGYLGFSGSTGWATNWHSIDNLYVDQGCEVP